MLALVDHHLPVHCHGSTRCSCRRPPRCPTGATTPLPTSSIVCSRRARFADRGERAEPYGKPQQIIVGDTPWVFVDPRAADHRDAGQRQGLHAPPEWLRPPRGARDEGLTGSTPGTAAPGVKLLVPGRRARVRVGSEDQSKFRTSQNGRERNRSSVDCHSTRCSCRCGIPLFCKRSSLKNSPLSVPTMNNAGEGLR